MPSDRFANLSGRNAVVTGSSSGIGRAIAVELARAGANIVLQCREEVNAVSEAAEEVRRCGVEAVMLTADFSQPEECREFVEQAWQRFDRVHVWVNNAGVDLLTGEPTGWPYEKKLQALFDVDIRSTVVLSREVGRRMTERGGGVILNIGWDQADRGMEGESGELFATAKNAVMGFSRSLAVSLAPHVRVNCIAPGWIRTKWGEQASEVWQERVRRETPLQRWGSPEDVARMARFLAGDEAGFITGQVINVNGGAVR